MIESWHIWLIAALILLIIEVLTSGFASICFAIGALCSSIAAGLGAPLKAQLPIFAAVSLVCALVIRPIFIKYLSRRTKEETNAHALIGQTATVTETIDENGGRISVYGESWKAVSEDGSTIAVNSKVTITKIDSLIITVKQTEKQ